MEADAYHLSAPRRMVARRSATTGRPASCIISATTGSITNSPEDLMVLCVECHEKIHKLPKPANDNEPQLPLAFPV